MKLYLAVVGALLALSGFVFVLQGMGVVGPSSSFMFQNNTWIYQGGAVFVIGVILMAAGIFAKSGKGSMGSNGGGAGNPSVAKQ